MSDYVQTLVSRLRERDATIEQLLAQLPPDGQGRWRQGTKNPRNLYVHQGDDEVGQPVGQMYSAELAALVCDAVNAEDLAGRQRQDHQAEIAEAEEQIRAAEGERDEYRRANTQLQELATLRASERDLLDVRLDEISRGFIKANRLHPVSEDGTLCTTCKRPYPCPTVTALSSIDDHASEVIAERDQLKAAVARVKALAKDMRTWCSPHGIAVTYAGRIEEAIEPPERDHDALLIGSDSEEFAAIICATMRKHRAEVHPEHAEGCGNCAVIKGAPEVLTYGLDSSDLPAVREFAADFDPRET